MRSNDPHSRVFHPAGLTLVELLIVLSIIAVVSTAALRSVVGTFEQQNYDSNVSQLEEIELAVLGDDDTAGFVGDIGRLPIARGADATTQLSELWNQNVAVAANISLFAINVAPADEEVRLGTGWRGPYLNVGINRNDLTDGFANSFLMYESDGSLVADTETVSIIQSFGANGNSQVAPDGSDASYDEDFEVIFDADAAIANVADAATNTWQSQINVNVNADSGTITGGSVILRVYGPDGSGGLTTIEQESRDATGTASLSFVLDGVSDPDNDPDTNTGDGLSFGSRVIRAYKLSVTKGDPNFPDDAQDVIIPVPVTFAVDNRSPATHVVIDRFTSTINLTLY
ncbi:MAG: type II secretion system protein [Verrucomicrobiota bacterium]